MTSTQRAWRQVYDKVAPALVVICLLASLFASVGVFMQNRFSQREQEARLADNARLLDCFDDFASDLAGGLPPVRTATANANDALASALVQLKIGLAKVGAGTFKPGDLNIIIERFDAYQRASERLVEVREQNPYPPAPSTFCKPS